MLPYDTNGARTLMSTALRVAGGAVMSIRTRLAIAVALVLVITIGLLGTVFVRSTRATLISQIDEQVMANAARNQAWREPPRDGNGDHGPQGGYGPDNQSATGTPATTESAPDGSSEVQFLSVARFVYNADGELVFDEPCGFTDDPKPPPQVPEIPSEEIQLLSNKIVTTPSVDGTFEYRMLVEQTPSGETIVTASPLDGVDDTISELIQTLVIVGLFAMVAATATSWWLIRRGMRPVDQMVDTAAAIAGGDLSRRVESSDPRTELGRLGGALNDMLGQIESALDARTASESRLRRFVADAAHELRTPLTSLRGYAELYRQGRDSGRIRCDQRDGPDRGRGRADVASGR